ncbi:hypothetical protein VTL71DRAFT_7313 [Oculimacula yallundae]|uniref:Uncharacterized protein n=1 Tax=Oculimacula yallundae TaxID=86028 RepID=A0ABR4BWB6_9HELO
MSTGSRMPTSFSEVFHNDTWDSIRDYDFRGAQDGKEVPHRQSKPVGPASPPDSSRKTNQKSAIDTSRANLVETFEDQASVFYQPLLDTEPDSPGSFSTPATSIRELHVPNTPHPHSFGQTSMMYSSPPDPRTPKQQQQTPVWNNPPQPSTTYPTPRYSPGGSGALPLDSPLANSFPGSPSGIQYHFVIVPLVVNGMVCPCWCALPEIVSNTSEQLEDEGHSPTKSVLPEPPAPRNFQPTNMVLELNKTASNFPTMEPNYEVEPYRGDLSSQANRRQVHQLPDTHNCTLWLWNIPAALWISELFDQIDTGAVQCCHIVPPNEAHITCAAKLAFMAPEAATKFKEKVDSEKGVWLKGHKLMARFNRDGNLRNHTQQTRVLVIEGPNNLMTIQYWEAYFRKICVFQWDRVLELPCVDKDKKILQFAFVRLDGQAQASTRSPPDDMEY